MIRLLIDFKITRDSYNLKIDKYYQQYFFLFFKKYIGNLNINTDISLFSFSDIRKALKEYNKDILILPKVFTIEFSTIYKEVIDSFIDNTFLKHKLDFTENIKVYIKKMKYLKELSLKELSLNSNIIYIKSISPIVIYANITEKDIVYYFNPSEKDFCNLLKEDSLNKYKKYYNKDYKGIFEFKVIDYKVRGFVYKNKLISAYYVNAYLKADFDFLKLLYYTGLGYDNEKGFGLFNITEKEV